MFRWLFEVASFRRGALWGSLIERSTANPSIASWTHKSHCKLHIQIYLIMRSLQWALSEEFQCYPCFPIKSQKASSLHEFTSINCNYDFCKVSQSIKLISVQGKFSAEMQTRKWDAGGSFDFLMFGYLQRATATWNTL